VKGLYLTFSNPQKKSGLFYSTHERIAHSISYLSNYKIISVQFYDNWFLTLLKRIFGVESRTIGSDYFIYDKLKYEYVYLKRGLFSAVTTWGRFDKLRIFKVIFNENYLYQTSIRTLFLIAKEYDFIMAHWGYPIGRIAMTIFTHTKVPFYVTYHGSDLNLLPGKNIIAYSAIKETLTSSVTNFMVSNALYRQAVYLYGSITGYVSHNGIRADIIQQKPHKILSERAKIIFVGNLNNDKRADLLPELVEEIIRKTDKSLSFYIVGEGKYRNLLENRFKHIKYETIITGQLSNDKVLKLIGEADILILPSRREGLPLVLLEAIALNTIPIACNVGGVAELLSNDFLVNESDQFINDFANKVIQMLNNPQHPILEIANFTWGKIIKTEMEIINQTLHAR